MVAEVRNVSAVVEQHAHRTAAIAFVSTLAICRAEFIRTAQYTARVMIELATARANAAATYRQMASGGGPSSLRYLQHAEQLDQLAARARRLADREAEEIDKWQHRDPVQDTAG